MAVATKGIHHLQILWLLVKVLLISQNTPTEKLLQICIFKLSVRSSARRNPT